MTAYFLKMLLPLGCLPWLVSCSGSNSPANATASEPALDSPSADSIVFEPASTLTLEPMERASLSVRLTPAREQLVRFAIIAPEVAGVASDASLNQDEVLTDADGRATVDITAPTKATTFRVRATTALLTSERGMSVSGTGFARLLITPEYSGNRSIGEWVVSVSGRMPCAAHALTPGVDGDIVARGKPGAAPMLLEAVPAGTNLTVLVRADHMAAGCLDVAALMPNKTENLSVTASDLPLHFESPSLATRLALNSASQSFYDTLARDIDQALTALTGTSAQDVDALLDTMGNLAGPQQAAFTRARTDGSWDDKLAKFWGDSAPIHFRSLASAWMSAGVKSLSDPDAITGHLRATQAQSKQALFDLTNVGQVDAVRAGFAPSAAATWSAEPGDRLLLGLSLFWRPSELVTALAERQAKFATQTQLFSLALRQALACTELGAVLAPISAAYSSCGSACLADLCGDAAAVLWDNARSASGAEARTLQINASSQATVDAAAQVLALKGNWLGMLGVLPNEVSVGGTLSANAATP